MSSFLSEGRKTAALALPLIIGQVSQMAMMIADTVMVGKIGVTELAALTFANAFFSVPFVFGIGLITSISVLTSTAHGAVDDAKARAVCRNGFYLALGVAFLLALVAAAFLPILEIFNQPKQVTKITPPYLAIILVSLVPALGSLALKNHGDSLGHPWPSFSIFLGGVILNIVLNQIFIFELGYGLIGAGWATLISRTAIVIGMLLWFRYSQTLADSTPNRWFARPDRETFRRLFALGIPASFHLLAEVGAFSGAGFLVGMFGEVPLAAHQIALNTGGVLFMFPLGIAIALTMRMGNAAGANQPERYSAIVGSGLVLTAILIGLTAAGCWFGREMIAGWYVSEKEVRDAAIQFLVIVAIFQAGDALQVVGGGILRGLEDVTVPAWAAGTCHLLIALPVGSILAWKYHFGPTGIWWGLALGLSCAAVFLNLRVWQKVRQV